MLVVQGQLDLERLHFGDRRLLARDRQIMHGVGGDLQDRGLPNRRIRVLGCPLHRGIEARESGATKSEQRDALEPGIGAGDQAQMSPVDI